MEAILDSQSDAIVAIQSATNQGTKSKSKQPQGLLDTHPVIFTNKKSKELFGCDLLNGQQEENLQKIDEPCFVQITG